MGCDITSLPLTNRSAWQEVFRKSIKTIYSSKNVGPDSSEQTFVKRKPVVAITSLSLLGSIYRKSGPLP